MLSFRQSWARTRAGRLRASCSCPVLFLSLLLASCGGSSTPGGTDSRDPLDDRSTSAGTSAGNNSAGTTSSGSTTSDGGSAGSNTTDSGSTTASGNTTTGSTGSGNPDNSDTSDQPVNLSLQTREELPVRAQFQLMGEASTSSAPKTNFSVVMSPLHGEISIANDQSTFTYLPQPDFFGVDSFVYSTLKGKTATVTIDVSNVNDAPVLFNEVQRAVEQGALYNSKLQVEDPDGDELTFNASNLPEWLKLDRTLGVLYGSPDQSDIGLFENIIIGVTDSAGEHDEISGITIEVIDINDAPTINPDQFPSELDARETVSVDVFPDDPDGDKVHISVEPNDFVSSIVSGGNIRVTANNVLEVTHVNLVVLATDLRGRSSREIIPLTLYPLTSSGKGRTLQGRAVGTGIHLVVLGDGYRSDQQSLFRSHVEELMDHMQADPGIARHFSVWNVHFVESESVDSGIDDNVAQDVRDTVFDAGYYCLTVQRLICADKLAMFTVALAEFPDLDQIVLLVNDTRYGGSGGSVAIASSNSMEVALHEMGHSIAGLADEYVDNLIPENAAGAYTEGQYPNVSRLDDPDSVPWSHWIDKTRPLPSQIGDPGVGVFEGAFYQATGFYRPTSDSLMRNYTAPLGPVNAEQWALSVYGMAQPILAISPSSRLVNMPANVAADFSVTPLFGGTTQSVQWRLNNRLITATEGRSPSVTLQLPEGRYTLSLTVSDISGQIRKPPPHNAHFVWNWDLVVR